MPAALSPHAAEVPAPHTPLHESLYVGIDVGKLTHVAGFVSTTLLERHGRFEGCPVLKFENSREGFRTLADRLRSYVALEQVFVLYVRYNQGIRQELTSQLEFLRAPGKIGLPHCGGVPHDGDTLGTVPACGTTRTRPHLAPEASLFAACPNNH